MLARREEIEAHEAGGQGRVPPPIRRERDGSEVSVGIDSRAGAATRAYFGPRATDGGRRSDPEWTVRRVE